MTYGNHTWHNIKFWADTVDRIVNCLIGCFKEKIYQIMIFEKVWSEDLGYSKNRKTMRNIQTKLDDGKNVKIPGEMNPYLKIEELNGRKTVIPANKVWDAQMEKKGFFSLASSRDFGAEQALQIYHLRDTSETGYCILKSQQGFSRCIFVCFRIKHSECGYWMKILMSFLMN